MAGHARQAGRQPRAAANWGTGHPGPAGRGGAGDGGRGGRGKRGPPPAGRRGWQKEGCVPYFISFQKSGSVGGGGGSSWAKMHSPAEACSSSSIFTASRL